MPLIAMSDAAAACPADEAPAIHGPYFLCGWRVLSALPLPELAPWRGEEAKGREAVEVQLLLGEAGEAEMTGKFGYSLQEDGSFLLELPGLAVFRVGCNGRDVTMQPVRDADAQLLRAHFYGSIVAVLCFFHGLLPLHGACVRVGDAAVIFTGASGAGKSTLAAAFVRSGYPLLCDDVCAIDLQHGQTPRVWPAFPRVKLLPDAIEAFALDTDTLYTQAARGEKGHFLIANDANDANDAREAREASAALPVGAIYLLQTSANEDIDIAPLQGAAAFLPLKTQVHRSSMGAAMGLRGQLFRELSTLLQTVPVLQLNRPMDLRRIGEAVQAVAHRHVGTAGAQTA